jgi:hypothetical protein
MRLALAVALALALVAAIARADIGEGNWNMEITTTMPGMPPGGMPIKQQRCLRTEDAKDPAELFGSPGAGCQFGERQDDGSTYRFKILCSGPTLVNGSGEMRYSKDAMDGQIVLNMSREGQQVQTRTTIKAQRTGPCVTGR